MGSSLDVQSYLLIFGKIMVIYVSGPLYVMCCFSLASFKIFYLYLFSGNLTIMC